MNNMVLTMPAIALRGKTILPGMIVHFDISREKSLRAVEASMLDGQRIFLVTQKDVEKEDPTAEDLFAVGIVAEIKQAAKLQKDVLRLLVEGIDRAQMLELQDRGDYLEAEFFVLRDETELPESTRLAMVGSIRDVFEQYAQVHGKLSKELRRQVQQFREPEMLIDYIGNNLPLDYTEKQKLLEAVTVTARYEQLMSVLYREIEVIQIKADLQGKVKERVDKHQREYVLREQMGVIREELGDQDPKEELDEYEKRMQELDASDEVKQRIAKEIRRLRSIPVNSAESTVSRDYIEKLLELPWNHCSVDRKDLDYAQELLDRDHFGLDKVKERILEYLAVRNLTGGGDAPILCLVGPPGTGKTSIAHSVADALERKFVRICLGGVRDEAEIRGHRRTYIGAMPGRIVQGLVQAQTANPLMLLDEIDKMSNDYKGDPSSALLEVLDGEQNKHFKDLYVELPIDLSEVLFLATANDADKIPAPLYDRMEIIRISGYTENEKLHIARDHLVEKQKKANGLAPKQLNITDDALKEIISSYTREAGVRELERRIGMVCRKAVRRIYQPDFQESKKICRVNQMESSGDDGDSPLQDSEISHLMLSEKDGKLPLSKGKTAEGKIAAGDEKTGNLVSAEILVVTADQLADYLGKPLYRKEMANEKDMVGIVRGLAWTSAGGVTLEVEVNVMPGKGEMKLTGKLGDVMKESAAAAISYVRSVSAQHGIPEDYFAKHDIHIHIPEGAVPKDGPSAGITMATAVLSAVTGRKVRADAAMTGEVTLRGRVLPIGGLKEKLLAAKMAGIQTVCIPKENERDLEEISEEITGGLEIIPVEEMEEVVKICLLDE